MDLISAMLARLTAQDIFDIAAWQLLNQGEQSRGGSICRYRGERGLRCAVGFFVPDDQYSEEFEGNGVPGLIVIAKRRGCDSRFVHFLARHLGLLTTLQRTHDENPPHAWPARLTEVAHTCGLYPSVVEHWRRVSAAMVEPPDIEARSNRFDRIVDEILVELPVPLKPPHHGAAIFEDDTEAVRVPYNVCLQPTQAREALPA